MSVRALAAVFSYSKAREGARLVMLALADRADDDGYCFPSLTELARKTLLDRRSVTRNLARLVKDDELRRFRRQHGPSTPAQDRLSRGQQTTLYQLTIAGLPGRGAPPLATPDQVGAYRPYLDFEGRGVEDTKVGAPAPLPIKEVRQTDTSKKRAPPKIDAGAFLADLWNGRASGKVRQVGELTPTRRRLAQAAWRGHPDPAWWRTTLTEAYRSRFLRGAKGWAMTFNWWLSKDNAVQISEGVHANKPGDFPRAEDDARQILKQTRGACRHEPTCEDREEHFDRLVDRILGVDAEPTS